MGIDHHKLSLVAIEEKWPSTLINIKSHTHSYWMLSDIGRQHIKWCEDHINGEWTTWNARIYFKREKDLTLYLLSWS